MIVFYGPGGRKQAEAVTAMAPFIVRITIQLLQNGIYDSRTLHAPTRVISKIKGILLTGRLPTTQKPPGIGNGDAQNQLHNPMRIANITRPVRVRMFSFSNSASR